MTSKLDKVAEAIWRERFVQSVAHLQFHELFDTVQEHFRKAAKAALDAAAKYDAENNALDPQLDKAIDEFLAAKPKDIMKE